VKHEKLGVCRTGSLKTAASELAKCNSDLVAVQEVRQDNGGSQPADDYIETRITTQQQAISYTRKLDQQLRRGNSSVTGRHI
jgi:endonuclease/exonuclease/phosphatase family metal-dependent hydrolase